MENKIIKIIGARENNLKNISLEIPKYKLVALTGVSGSGKSSLAIEILQKECSRQYMESMGLVTDGLNKPNVENIVGLSPAIAIRQRILSNNPRSTVGTYTEILTYLRLLFAKLGTRKCEHCNNIISPDFENESELNQQNIICKKCNTALKHLKMADFSFNKPEGACKKCNGIGVIKDIDFNKLINENLTIKQGAIKIWNNDTFAEHYSRVYEMCGKHYGFDFDVSKKIKEFSEIERLVLFDGVESKEFIKLFPNIKKPKRVMDGYVEGLRTFVNKKIAEGAIKKINNPIIAKAIVDSPCNECNGSRLGFYGRTTTLHKKTITQVSNYTIDELLSYLASVEKNLCNDAKLVAQVIINDIRKRCNAIINIGLSYLSISRSISSLSGGESQRLKLTNIMDSGLTGVLYILDEPTTGLHAADNEMLLNSIYKLRDLGNTIIVIEHDLDFIKKCDHVIDFGPLAGSLGGEIVACGTPKEILKFENSLTAKYLKKPKKQIVSSSPVIKDYIEILGARAHNLKNVNVKIPLNNIVTLTGVSGSGKSSLIFDVLEKYYKEKKAEVDKITGLEKIKNMVVIDQKAIGKMNRSNVATYTDVYTLIRELFAKLSNSKEKNFKAADFSFNVKGGRCEKCLGLGVIPLEMQFLDDVEITCPACKGKRFKKEILEVKYNNKNISDILDTTIDDLIEFFDKKEIKNKLKIISEVGLGYLKLGQSSNTLSGGECQRLKLSKELSKPNNGNTLYLFDEPTTGLHVSDINKLITLFKKLISKNNSIIIIEHSLEIIASGDYIIDLGPKGGINGGEIMAIGTPFEIKKNKNCLLSKFL